ncbi:MAG TPA: hypothetical protein ENI20_01375 [Bacteroides sp.]|nr:hypothetical protein [Bacteroides sp.]
MTALKTSILMFMLIAGIIIGSIPGYSQTRYIDATLGDDGNNGLTAQSAWMSLNKLNNRTFIPGDSILFKAGEKWSGILKPEGSGKNGSPIVISSYGPGPRPEIHGRGMERYTLLLENQEYWEIRNLRITNFEDTGGSEPDRKRGIYVKATDMGAVHHIHLFNLEVDSVNSENSSFTSRYYGGIFFEVTGSEHRTWFEDVLVDSCYIHDVSRTGISNSSSWSIRTLNSSFGSYIGKDNNGNDRYDTWVPSKNIILKRNTIRRIAGNGIIIRVADKPLIEYNYLDSCGLYISGNAAFCFNTDKALFQYNEACYTVYNEGDTDARGIDSDYRTKNTIIQYNYLHHNEFGGVVATGGAGGSSWLETFNDGTVIRYNIISDNKDHIVRTSGKLTNMTFHNNILYTSKTNDLDDMIILYHGDWGGTSAKNSYYYNNIFYHLAANPVYDFGGSQNNVFENNLFFGNRAPNEPHDDYKVTGDPLLVDPGTDNLDGYMIRTGSPAIKAGKTIPSQPEMDFFNNPIPLEGPIDIGIHQTDGPLSDSGIPVSHSDPDQAKILLYPNPTPGLLNLKMDSKEDYMASWSILENNGIETRISGMSWLSQGTSKIQINLKNNGLHSGIYIFRIADETGNFRHKHFLFLN